MGLMDETGHGFGGHTGWADKQLASRPTVRPETSWLYTPPVWRPANCPVHSGNPPSNNRPLPHANNTSYIENGFWV